MLSGMCYQRACLHDQLSLFSHSCILSNCVLAVTVCPVMLQFDASARLTADDFENTRRAAMGAVRVPQHVIQLLADLRTYLQEKIEPPVYVSDRRLVKAVALMQVSC